MNTDVQLSNDRLAMPAGHTAGRYALIAGWVHVPCNK